MLLDKVRRIIDKNELLNYGDSVICAVSGGADSVCLLHMMKALQSEYNLRLYIANVNHLIRGEESDEDSLFVKELAKAYGIELFYREYNVREIAEQRKIGEEECGRLLRYEFFEEISEKLGGAKIATAHNLNDNAETVLFRLIRGTSPKGLCGILHKRGNIIRPLLDISRSDIEQYLKANGILWREDSTNKIPIYTRNKIRLEIIPLLKEISPSAEEKIVSASGLIFEDNAFLSELASEKEKECFSENVLLIKPFENNHIAIKRRIAASVLLKWGIKELTAEKVESFLEYIKKDSGKVFDLNGRASVRKTYAKITLCDSENKEEFSAVLGENGEITWEKWRIHMYRTTEKIKKSGNNIAVFDGDKLKGPFEVTNKRDGDRIALKGIGGTKKVSDIFTDEKIEPQERNNIPVVRQKDEILFVCGVRQSSKYCVDENTKEYLVIKYEKKGE